jgi:hypothetical protein
MELYKYINNEALSEDNKAKRIVMDRIRKNLRENQEENAYLPLQGADKSKFEKAFFDASDKLDDIINSFEYGEYRISDEIYDLGSLPNKFNNLFLIIGSLNYRLLEEGSKRYINGMMDKLIPKLTYLGNMINASGIEVFDAFKIPILITQIQSRKYSPLVYEYTNQQQQQQQRQPQPEENEEGNEDDEEGNDDEDDAEDENEGPEQEEIEEGQDIPEDQPNIPIPQPPPPPQVVNQAPVWNWYDLFE